MYDRSYQQMKKDWERIIAFGPHPFGSQALSACSEYLLQALSDCAGNARASTFMADGFQAESWSLQIDGAEITSWLFLGSGSSDGFRGRLRYAGKNRVWDMYTWDRYMVVDASDNICAYITVRGNGKAIPQTLAEGNSALPHFIVGAEESERMAEAAGREATVTGAASTHVLANAVGRDLIATVAPGEKRVLLCAHYDTVYNTPGAYDNSSGPAVLLEVARRLRGRSLKTGLEIALIDGEEFRLLGSTHLAKTEHVGVQLVINVDGVGREPLLEVWSGPETLERTLRRCFAQNPEIRDVLYTCPPPPGSDQAPYYALGIPACTLTFNDQGTLHSPEDLYDDDKLNNMAVMVRIVVHLLEKLGILE